MTTLLLAALLAAAASDGPGAILAPRVARPGDAVLVRVRTAAGTAPAGTLAGRPLQFFPRGGESWALAAIPLETPSGPMRLELAPGGPFDLPVATLEVVEPGFPSRSITVAAR